MNQKLLKEDNFTTTEITTQATPAIDLDRQQNFGSDGLMEILLMGAVTVIGFRIIYRKSILYLDRIHPIKPNIWQKLTRPNCKKCRFYNHSSDFKCELHPLVFKLVRAESCPDYWQSDRRKFLHR